MKKFKLLSLICGAVLSCGILVMATGCGEEVQNVSVSFHSEGGISYKEITANVGDTVVLPKPSREGYTFVGWYDNAEFEGEALSGEFVLRGETVFYAKWEMICGSVTFVSNGGTEYEKVDVQGQKVALPTPERENFVFSGWYDNAAFEGTVYQGDMIPAGDITLYAKWTYAAIDVTFDSMDGNDLSIMQYTGTALELPTPERYGYTFDGWYEQNTYLGTAMESPYVPTSDVTLYAKWSKCTYLYLYYGETQDWKRFEYQEGDVITLSELYALYTPDDLEVESLGSVGYAPFDHWAYEGETDATAVKVTDPITVGSETIILLAQYDRTGVPPKVAMTYDQTTETYTTTGRVGHVFYDEGKAYGEYSMRVAMNKGVAGAVGPAFRMNMPNTDDQYEADCYYMAAQVLPATGNFQVLHINGSWSAGGHFSGSQLQLATLPQTWQDYYNGLNSGELMGVTIKVVLTADDMCVYISDYGTVTSEQLIWRYRDKYSDTTLLDRYSGTGFGLRSTTAGKIIYDIEYVPYEEVTFRETYRDESMFTLPVGASLDAIKGWDSDVMYEDENDSSTAYLYQFVGWSLQENGEIIDAIPGACTLYAVYEKVTENLSLIEYVVDGQTFRETAVKNGGSIRDLISATKQTETKQNGNIVEYTFDGWYLEETYQTRVDDTTVFNGDDSIYAKFISKETRNGFLVTYDENGVIYSTVGNRSTAAGNQGITFDGANSALTQAGTELTYQLTFYKIDVGDSNCRARMMLFVEDDGLIDITGTSGQNTVWFDFSTASGQLILGSKIGGESTSTGTDKSINNYVTALTDLSVDCPYRVYYESLENGDKAVFNIKMKYGVDASGHGWMKLYIQNSLIYTYGFTADAATHTTTDGKTLSMVDGEVVWDRVCDGDNHTCSEGNFIYFYNYMTGGNLGNSVGIWSWGGEVNNGGYAVSNIQSVAIKEGGEKQ